MFMPALWEMERRPRGEEEGGVMGRRLVGVVCLVGNGRLGEGGLYGGCRSRGRDPRYPNG